MSKTPPEPRTGEAIDTEEGRRWWKKPDGQWTDGVYEGSWEFIQRFGTFITTD